MATKNLVPREDLEGKLGLENRRWLGVNASNGSFNELKTDSLLNKAGNPLIVSGDNSIVITGPSDPADGNGAQYTITTSDSGSSNAEVDRIFAGSETVPQSQAVISIHDVNDQNNNKIVFKTLDTTRWFIDSSGHYLPNTPNAYNIGNDTKPVNKLYLSGNESQKKGIRFVDSSNYQVSLNTTNDTRRLIVSSNFDSNNDSFVYDNLVVRKSPVKVSTTEELSATYDSEAGTLTANNNGTLTIDGVDILANDRVLVNHQTNKIQNGIYKCTSVGDVENSFVLTRSNDLSIGDDFSSVFVEVLEGQSNSGNIFYASSDLESSLVGTNNITWSSFKSSGLEKVEDDSSPRLSNNLDLNAHNLASSSTVEILPDGTSVGEGLSLNKNLLKINFVSASQPDSVIPELVFGASSDKEIKIKSPTASEFFTGGSIASNQFTFTFRHVNLTQAEKDNSLAYLASEGFVNSEINSQGFITSADLPDVSNFISTADDANLSTLTLSTSGSGFSLTAGNKRIGLVATPSNGTDAANKDYVDALVQGINSILDTCLVATVSNLNSIYANQQLTSQANGALSSNILDNVDINLIVERDETDPQNIITGSRILVSSQDNESQNGIYEVIDKGNASSPWILERAEDFRENFEASGSFIYVEKGDVNSGKGLVCTSPSNNDTVGTDDIKFTIFSGAGEIQAGSGLTLSGNTLNANIKDAGDDQIIFIDNDNKFDANITNIITKINTAGGVEASNAASFTWPSTSLSPIAADDQIVIKDLSSQNGDVKNASVNNLKQTMLAFDTSDIDFTYTASPENWTASIGDEKVTNVHLNQSVVTGLTEVDETPGDNDYFMIKSDSQNGLRKVSYENLKSGISATPDFSNLSQIPDDDISGDDTLIINNSTDNTSYSIELNKITLNTVVLPPEISGNTIELYSGNRYVYVVPRLGNDVSQVVNFNLNDTVEGTSDIVPEGSSIELEIYQGRFDQDSYSHFHYQKLFNISGIDIQGSQSVSFNWIDLESSNILKFTKAGGYWRSRQYKRSDSVHSNTRLINFVEGELNDPTKIFVQPYYFVGDTSSQITLNLPETSFALANGVKYGNKLRLYFTHTNMQQITITSSGDEIIRRADGNSGSRVPRFGGDNSEKIITFANSAETDIPYVDIELISANDAAGSQSEGWLVSSPYDTSGASGFEPPTAEQNELIKWNGTAWVAGKIGSINIDNGSITGGVDNNGAPTSTIAAETIVGGNIADDTITHDKLKNVNNKKVLGSLSNSGDNENPTNTVTEINVLDDTTSPVADGGKHTNLATWTAIKEYVDDVAGRSTSAKTVIEYNAYSADPNPDPSRPNTIVIGESDALGDSTIHIVNNVQSGFGAASAEHYNTGAFGQSYLANVAPTFIYFNPENTVVNEIRGDKFLTYPNLAVQSTINIKLPRIETWIANRGFDPLVITYEVKNVANDINPLASLTASQAKNKFASFRFIPSDLDFGAYSTYGGNDNTVDAHVRDNPYNEVPVYMNGDIDAIVKNGQTSYSNLTFLYEEANAAIISEKQVGVIKTLEIYPTRVGSLQQYIGRNMSYKTTVNAPYVWSIKRVG